MRRHFDLDQFRRHVRKADRVLPDQVREHDLFVGVFVIDAEQPAVAAVFQREERDVIVVVAELLELRCGALLKRVERGRVGEQRIAPSEQNVGAIAFGHMVRLVDAGFHLGKVEAIRRAHGLSAAAGKQRRPEQGVAAPTPSVPRIISRRL